MFTFRKDRAAIRLCASLISAAVVATVVTAEPVSAQAPAPSMNSSVRNEATVRAAFDRWRTGGSVFNGLLSPDIVWTIPGSGQVAGTYRGLRDFVDRASVPLVSRLATPLAPEVRNVWAVGNQVIIRFDASATTTSGAPYRNQFVWVFKMKDDLVVEAEAFLDLVAYQQVVDNNQPRSR